jgi:hypothetical protein
LSIEKDYIPDFGTWTIGSSLSDYNIPRQIDCVPWRLTEYGLVVLDISDLVSGGSKRCPIA